MTSVPHYAALSRETALSRMLRQEENLQQQQARGGEHEPPIENVGHPRPNTNDAAAQRERSSVRQSIPVNSMEGLPSQPHRYERAISKSFHPPRKISGYEYHVVNLDNELEKRSSTDKKLWKKCRFTLDENGITCSKLHPSGSSDVVTEQESSSVLPPPPPPSFTEHIPNEMIKTLKQTSTSGHIDSFTIVTKKGKEFVLRSSNKDTMTNWIFELQKVVAKAITSQISGQGASLHSPPHDLEVKGTRILTSFSPRGTSSNKVFSQGCRSPERVYSMACDVGMAGSGFVGSSLGESGDFDGEFDGFSSELGRRSSCSSAGGDIDCFEMDDFPSEMEFAGVHAEQGDRHNMEDTHIVIDSLGSYAEEQQWSQDHIDLCKQHNPHQVFCVFDGHSGTHAAEFMEREFVNALIHSPAFKHDPSAAITECFEQLDKQFMEEAIINKCTAGCTALVVIRRGYKLFWGNIGDSRAIVGTQMKNGLVKTVALNTEHNCGLPEEAARVKAAGGWFSEEKEWFVDRFSHFFGSNPDLKDVESLGDHWKTLYRLNDEITVSRAIGDYFCKGKENMDNFEWLYPHDHPRTFSSEHDLVTSEPEVGVYDIPNVFDEESRIFIVLACDGLWDVVSNQLAATFVNLKVREGSFQNCSEELVKLALRLGSLDNVSVIVAPLASDN